MRQNVTKLSAKPVKLPNTIEVRVLKLSISAILILGGGGCF